MRRYIRHPSDMPIEVSLEEIPASERPRLNDISLGGLSFNSKEPFDINATIRLKIPLARLTFEAVAEIIWCQKTTEHFVIGAKFLDKDDMFKARMVEQVCYIEHYKKEVLRKEGRNLTTEEAAHEWIKKYAKDFPIFEEKPLTKL